MKEIKPTIPMLASATFENNFTFSTMNMTMNPHSLNCSKFSIFIPVCDDKSYSTAFLQLVDYISVHIQFDLKRYLLNIEMHSTTEIRFTLSAARP